MFKHWYNRPVRAVLFGALAVLLPATVYAQSGGNYDLTWSTIGGGGGRSAGGPYVLEGTIGQADTGVSSAGSYVLSAGFWPGQSGCVVNLTDLIIFVEQWLASTPGAPFNAADFDASGSVNIGDFAMLSEWWLDHCPTQWPLK
jgi:hypothetical protein